MHLIFAQYHERLRRLRSSPSTLVNHERTAALFTESGLDPLTARDFELEEWLASLPYKPRTRRLHFENLSAVYAYAQRRGILNGDPMDGVRIQREPDKEPRILTHAELRRMKDACYTDQQMLLFHLFAYTGMRNNEVRCLTWEDIAPDSIRVVYGKGGKLRHVPAHPALQEILSECRRQGPVLHGWHGEQLGPSGMWSRLRKISGGLQVTFHDFRRTVATSLAENDVAESVIDEIMGWAPPTVGRRYYIRVAKKRTHEAILRLYADDPL